VGIEADPDAVERGSPYAAERFIEGDWLDGHGRHSGKEDAAATGRGIRL
jgi:hypothetical protein